MKALRAHHRGGPETLVYESAPDPQQAPGEVIVEVHAAGVTFAELSWDETWTRDGKDRTPIIPTHEFSGVVVEVPDGVSGFGVGDEVFGMIPFDQDGAAAERASAPASDIVTKPAGLSHRDAATVPISGLTAWQALVDHAHVQPDENVLILGGTGAVGTFLVQIAHQLGAHVTATIRRDDEGLLAGLGADRVVRGGEPGALAASSIDVIVDAAGNGVTDDELDALRPGARVITLAGPVDPARIEKRPVTAEFFVVTPDPQRLHSLAEQVVAGSLRTLVSDVYPLDRGQQAFAAGGGASRPFGKTVLAVA